MLSDGVGVRVLEVFGEFAEEDGPAGEEVRLERGPEGDLRLCCRTWGRAVKLRVGEGTSEYRRVWTVRSEHVPRAVRAFSRELFPDTMTLRAWLANAGIPSGQGGWYGYAVRPLDEDRFLLELVRAVIGVEDDDECTKIAERFTARLAADSIEYEFGEGVTDAR